MEYNKLCNKPPAYSDLPQEGNGPPSAPPTEMMYTAPVYAPHPPAPPVNVVTHNTIVMDNATQGMICPHCHARIRMTVKHHATCSTYVYSALLCLLLFWPCVCLPCCCDCGYKTTQSCPNCKACLGRF